MSGAKSLIPLGRTVGIKLFSQGVMVVKLAEGDSAAKDGGLQIGDVILQCGGAQVTSAEQFQELLQEDGTADLRVSRNGGEITVRVEPERNEDGVCQIGAWIRDSMAGIGTLTWYDPETNRFGALGHGVTDVDTGLLMPFQDGSILKSTVKAVKRGERGSAGELRGDFDLTRDIGYLYANTDRGVFGTVSDGDDSGVFGVIGECGATSENADGGILSGVTDAGSVGDAISSETPVPLRQPVKGAARILSNVEGDAVREYAIEITRVIDGADDGRDMEIKVTDPELLARTGGIVQGMSGSPILQNGGFVGAVTHVLLQDPTRGYGISMETMLAAS